MPITGVDSLVTSIAASEKQPVNKASLSTNAGRFTSLWTAAGTPAAPTITAGSTTNTGSTSGSIPSRLTSPQWVTGFRGVNTGATGMLVLFDLLWTWTSGTGSWNPSGSTTTAQTTGNAGTTTCPRGSGVGTELWFEIVGTTTANALTVTVGYTNSAGTTGRSATTGTVTASQPVGAMWNLVLAAGDVGVQSVQSIAVSAGVGAATSTTVARVSWVRRVAEIPILSTSTAVTVDAFDLGLPQIVQTGFTTTPCLMMAMVPSSTITGVLTGSFSFGI